MANYWEQLRQTHQVTYNELAALLDCNSAQVRAYLSGYIMPKDRVIHILCDRFNLDFDIGSAAFKSIFIQWGLDHKDKYVQHGNSYIPRNCKFNQDTKCMEFELSGTNQLEKPTAPADTWWEKLRKTFGITYADLSNLLNIEYSALVSYFYGDAIPDSDTIAKLCNYFSISIDEGTRAFKQDYHPFGKSTYEFIPRKRSVGANCKTNNFWRKQRVVNQISMETIRNTFDLPKHRANGIFSGQYMPSDEIISYLCSICSVDFDQGKAEFKKMYDAWHRLHDTPSQALPTYDKHKRVKNTTATIDLTEYLKLLYGVIPYDLFLQIKDTQYKDASELLSEIYGRIPYKLFQELRELT